jgi:two-component system, chemotaxis family, chemotaxis protein CheY
MTKTVLMIDDSPVIRRVMRSAMERDGYAVVEAVDGGDAASKLDGRALSAIVCDLWMPRMNGLEFLKFLRDTPRYRFTPLVVLTTESRSEMRQLVKEHGAQAFISKPCTPSQITDALKKLCV